MYLISLRDAAPGMVLAKTIFNDRGDALLQSGVALSPSYLRLLDQRGFLSIYVRDSDDEEVPEDIVSERVRQQAYQRLRAVFDLQTAVGAKLAAIPPERRLAALSSGEISIGKRGGQEHRLFENLAGAVSAIIEDVLGAPLLLNLHTLRTYHSYTFDHCVDMTIVAVLLGKKLHLSLENLHRLATGCMLHDIGKLFVPPEILDKPGPLTAAEWDTMRQHPLLGYEFLRRSNVRSVDVVARHVALQHHERQDGTGYPRGLRGTNAIPIHKGTPRGHILPIAEIAAVADVYDALRADRPYRKAYSPEEVVHMLREMAGSHLNVRVVETLFSAMPVYPTGTAVRVTSGDYEGHRGVVVQTLPDAVDRPMIRLLEDPSGQRIPPLEVDLRDDPSVEIVSAAISSFLTAPA